MTLVMMSCQLQSLNKAALNTDIPRKRDRRLRFRIPAQSRARKLNIFSEARYHALTLIVCTPSSLSSSTAKSKLLPISPQLAQHTSATLRFSFTQERHGSR